MMYCAIKKDFLTLFCVPLVIQLHNNIPELCVRQDMLPLHSGKDKCVSLSRIHFGLDKFPLWQQVGSARLFMGLLESGFLT